MKIGYIDAKVNNPPEDYALNAKGYGGGSCFARYAKEWLNREGDEFYIFASQDCFKNLGICGDYGYSCVQEDNKEACVSISESSLGALRNFGRLKDHIPDAESFDIFIHHHDLITFNMEGLKAPLVHWALMGDGGANRGNPYTLLYKPGERAHQGKGFPVKIGKYVSPTYIKYPKQDYIFQCSRHDQHMNTIEVAQFCLTNNVRGIFAGPILDNYPLKNYIDNINTFYLGEISEEMKMRHAQHARLCTFLFNWDAPFNQSAIEALGWGTPIVAHNRGFFSYLVKEGANGFFKTSYSGEGSLKAAWDWAHTIKGEECWNTARNYSHEAMIDSFYNNFNLILQDWKK